MLIIKIKLIAAFLIWFASFLALGGLFQLIVNYLRRKHNAN